MIGKFFKSVSLFFGSGGYSLKDQEQVALTIHQSTYDVYIDFSGTKHWYLDGKRHREDGPAVESISGAKFWYLDGKLHREDGPAIEHGDGTTSYWYNNEKFPSIKNNAEWARHLKLMKCC